MNKIVLLILKYATLIGCIYLAIFLLQDKKQSALLIEQYESGRETIGVADDLLSSRWFAVWLVVLIGVNTLYVTLEHRIRRADRETRPPQGKGEEVR